MERHAAALLAVSLSFLWTPSGSAAQERNDVSSPLLGVWSEDCKSSKPQIVITPEYHAIVSDLRSPGKALGLGRIERADKNGKEITLAFSTSFLNQIGEEHPRYRLSRDGEIIAVRSRDIWKTSDSIYREEESARPEGYVSLNEHEYGMKYHRCIDDWHYIQEKMRQIVADNSQWLQSQKSAMPEELEAICSESAAMMRNIISLQDSGLTFEQAQETIEAKADPQVKPFVLQSAGLAYSNADEVTHALDKGMWLKACVKFAKEH